MQGFDVAFFLAVGALGWGLSLATYRAFATHFGWPRGSWHEQRPQLPVLIGGVCVLVALMFGSARVYSGLAPGGWAIPLFGIAWAVFWTGFLRVGAQSALLLAPVATALLAVVWYYWQ